MGAKGGRGWRRMGGGTRRPGNAQAAGDGETGRQRGVKPAGDGCELRGSGKGAWVERAQRAAGDREVGGVQVGEL